MLWQAKNLAKRNWRVLCEELTLEELEQIRYWGPQTVREIIRVNEYIVMNA